MEVAPDVQHISQVKVWALADGSWQQLESCREAVVERRPDATQNVLCQSG